MTRPKLRTLDPCAGLRVVDLGAKVRGINGSEPKVKVAAAFYGSTAWKSLMRRIIAERGRRCEDVNCTTPGRGAGRVIYGDHVVELRDGGAPLDPRNVLLRCPPCHGRKSAAERVARAAREAQEARKGRGSDRAGGYARKTGVGTAAAEGSSDESGPDSGNFFSPGRRR